MVTFSSPANMLYLNSVFALIYCILNISFGLFLIVSVIKLMSHNTQVAGSVKKMNETRLEIRRIELNDEINHGG
jgi:hypothetical protein